MEQRTSDLVIPCLTQMAVSAADDTLWKQLNYQILLKTRHNLPQACFIVILLHYYLFNVFFSLSTIK